VTEQKNVEERLRLYNERFEILSKATNDAIWDLDLRTNVVVWSHAIRSTFGYNEDNLNSNPDWWRTKIHPEDSERVNSEFDLTLTLGRNSWSSVYRFRCADGSYKFVSNRSYILYENNIAVRAIGALQDITESVKATEEIQKLSLVASQISSGVIIMDPEGRIEWVNDSLLRMTGYIFNELAGRTIDLLNGPESDATTVKRITEKIRQRHEVSEEVINYTRSGEKFWVKIDIVPVFKENGELKNFIAIQTDITELKEYENSITVIAEELSTLIENANVPIFGVDGAGTINEWNNVCRQLFEYRRDEVLGKKYQDIFSTPDAQKGFREMIDTALANVPVSNFELPLVTRKGTHLILLVSASPRRSKFKEITGVIFVGQNITELTDYRINLERKVEERTRDLHLALSKEQELVKLKNQFVSIASHEFRTPLTTISLAAGFIRRYKSAISEKTIDEKATTIEKQVSHMTYLLDDILVVGKADAGKLPVRLAPLEISPFIRNLADEVEKAHGSTHRIQIHETLRYREIMSDEKLLRNIIINLLTNAVKFSPASDRVDVSLKTHLDEMKIIVRDYGIGIPGKDRQNIFEPFFRAGNVHAIHGTGLGLSIIKKAVELLKGTISPRPCGRSRSPWGRPAATQGGSSGGP
jgi:PAS domain S-box-containing protein